LNGSLQDQPGDVVLETESRGSRMVNETQFCRWM